VNKKEELKMENVLMDSASVAFFRCRVVKVRKKTARTSPNLARRNHPQLANTPFVELLPTFVDSDSIL